ncbi:MAG: phosphopentomutase, partial [Anaerovibrio sp.]|nr:phosphopentomutase [Anaerovibrio sp.]
DYSMEPPGETILDLLKMSGNSVVSVGKINDIFAGKGISRHIAIENNIDGMNKVLAEVDRNFFGLCFVNLVDFDMKYGHRRDVEGYAQALTDFDKQLGEMLGKLKRNDVLIITADHGCDPRGAGTDHTREYVPMLIYGEGVKPGVDLGTRASFADIAATISKIMRIPYKTPGNSFWNEVKNG